MDASIGNGNISIISIIPKRYEYYRHNITIYRSVATFDDSSAPIEGFSREEQWTFSDKAIISIRLIMNERAALPRRATPQPDKACFQQAQFFPPRITDATNKKIPNLFYSKYV